MLPSMLWGPRPNREFTSVQIPITWENQWADGPNPGSRAGDVLVYGLYLCRAERSNPYVLTVVCMPQTTENFSFMWILRKIYLSWMTFNVPHGKLVRFALLFKMKIWLKFRDRDYSITDLYVNVYKKQMQFLFSRHFMVIGFICGSQFNVIL